MLHPPHYTARAGPTCKEAAMAYEIRGMLGDGRPGVVRQSGHDLAEALLKARHMVLAGLDSVVIEDAHGNMVAGDELIACCLGAPIPTIDSTIEPPPLADEATRETKPPVTRFDIGLERQESPRRSAKR
jgi:hypothetical protein